MSDSGTVIDEYGRLRGPGIHDATIREFKYVYRDRLDICLRGADRRDRWLRLGGIATVGFRDFVDGTIVSSVFCSRIEASAQDRSASTVETWRILFGTSCAEADFWATVAKKTEENLGRFLVLIEPSYGGSIAAICETISLKLRLPAHKSRVPEMHPAHG